MDSRVKDILNQMQLLNDELTNLRNQCKHSVYEVGWWSARPGQIIKSRICGECGFAIAGITKKEEDELGSFYKFNEVGV